MKQLRQTNLLKELLRGLPWNGEQVESPCSALSDTSLEQGYNVWSGPKLSKPVLVSFYARPDAKPVEIDLARYTQVGLAKSAILFPRSLKTGMHPIRRVGERFHDLPVFSLSDAWLTWRGLDWQEQTGVDSGDSHTLPPNN